MRWEVEFCAREGSGRVFYGDTGLETFRLGGQLWMVERAGCSNTEFTWHSPLDTHGPYLLRNASLSRL